MDRRALGQAGERLAAAHLEHKGYEILRRNVYSAQGEIDLITRAPDGTIVFVEVRTRRGAAAVDEAVSNVDFRPLAGSTVFFDTLHPCRCSTANTRRCPYALRACVKAWRMASLSFS